MRIRISTLFAVAILASLSVGLTWAALPVQDTLSVNYFVNAHTSNGTSDVTSAPDGTVQLTNPGTSGVTVWADIYVFYPDEEMSECCSCSLTPDDLRTLSINGDLTSNPLTSTPLTSGIIKIVSSSSSDPRTIKPVPSVRAWGTHILNTGITETEFQAATLSNAEVGSLQKGCSAIVLEGSGHGICSCGSGS